MGKKRFPRCQRFERFHFHIRRDKDFLHRLADFHQLRRPRLGVRLQLPSLGPVVGPIVVIDVAQQQAARRLMNN